MTSIGPMENVGRCANVLDEVYEERVRQEQLKLAGKFLWTCADNTFQKVTDNGRSEMTVSITNAEKLAVLSEEVGEVAKEVVEQIIHRDRSMSDIEDVKKIRKELIQVAAVCVAWVESLNKAGVTK